MGTVELTGQSADDSNIDQNTISQVMSFVIDSIKGPVNTVAEQRKVEIPTTFGVFTLSDLELIYHEGYIEAGLTPKFTQPATVFVPSPPAPIASDDFLF